MGLDNSSIAAKWPDVLRAIRNAKIEVVGEEDIGNDAHAQVLLSVIRAFGTSPIGFIFVEPCTRFSTIRPPDVLLCHPEVGLLVFEVKGYQPENIQKTIAGKFQISQKGRPIQVDPFRQASDAMFNIKNSAERFLRDAPLCNFVVVLPNVPRASFEEREFHQTVPMGQLLLKEDLDENCLRQKIGSLVRDSLKRRGDSNPLTHEQILGLRQVFGDSAVINSSRQGQHHSDESTLGALIDELDVQDKHLSREQLDLSRLQIGTFPRLIRGVAGSGKTVVLANLVARTLTRELGEGELFSQDERRELKIGVMCFNRALVPLLRQKIKDAFLNQTGHELNSNFVDIIHLNKLMSKIPIPYFKIKDIPDAKDRAVRYRAEMKDFQDKNADLYQGILFDAIFVDEGQDFEEEELQLLLDLLKPSQRSREKGLIVFYDDAQNLYAKNRPRWKDIGIDVQRGDRARVMKDCFRNTREIVELGFNVLVGTQANSNMRVATREYADIAYLKQNGLIEENDNFIAVRFAKRTFEKPIIKTFKRRDQELNWIGQEIGRLVDKENVLPEDILVLFDSEREFSNLPTIIKANVGSSDLRGFVRPYGENDEDKKEYIFKKNFITVSTTKGAKGYDAYVVFLVGVDRFRTDNRGRASFYVGATRAKLRLYLTGVERKDSLVEEVKRLDQILPRY